MRFKGTIPVFELERLYKEKYQGHEADIRFQPTLENMLGLYVEVDVPHMIAADEVAMKRFENAANRALRQMSSECSQIASEVIAAKKTNG